LFFLVLSILSPVIPLTIGYKKRSTLLWIYPLVGLLFDLTIFLFKRVLLLHPGWLGNLYLLIEFIIISFLYRDKIFKTSKLFNVFVIVFSFFLLSHTLFSSVKSFNVVGASFSNFIYIVYGVLGFYHLLQKQEVLYLEKAWFFWLNTALIIYASGNFLLFLFMDYLMALDKEMFLKIWYSVFQLLNITKNLLIAVALYHYKPPARESR
jgi:hypothetical protein